MKKSVRNGTIQVTNPFGTDPEHLELGGDQTLKILDDDREFFPRYDVVLLYRTDLPPDLLKALLRLERRITVKSMQGMIRDVETSDAATGPSQVAAQFTADLLRTQRLPALRYLLLAAALATVILAVLVWLVKVRRSLVAARTSSAEPRSA